jgi:cytochrome c oxidase subunit 1
LPAIGGRALWRPELLRWMPWLAFAGLLVFGAAGITAGYLGVPRRVMNVSYQNQAPALWHGLMLTVAIGGAIMAAALSVFAAGIAVSLFPARQIVASAVASASGSLTESWGGTVVQPGLKAWVGPISIGVIVIAMYAFSAVGFELMQALPVTATGGAAGH